MHYNLFVIARKQIQENGIIQAYLNSEAIDILAMSKKDLVDLVSKNTGDGSELSRIYNPKSLRNIIKDMLIHKMPKFLCTMYADQRVYYDQVINLPK